MSFSDEVLDLSIKKNTTVKRKSPCMVFNISHTNQFQNTLNKRQILSPRRNQSQSPPYTSPSYSPPCTSQSYSPPCTSQSYSPPFTSLCQSPPYTSQFQSPLHRRSPFHNPLYTSQFRSTTYTSQFNSPQYTGQFQSPLRTSHFQSSPYMKRFQPYWTPIPKKWVLDLSNTVKSDVCDSSSCNSNCDDQTDPKAAKDSKYMEKRVKNNLSAKKSRDAKKKREMEVRERAIYLEKENYFLRQLVLFFDPYFFIKLQKKGGFDFINSQFLNIELINKEFFNKEFYNNDCD